MSRAYGIALRLATRSRFPIEADGLPVHFAAQEGHTEVARVLLRGGAAVDARDSFGNTPLWRAVFESRGRGDTIKVLLAAGANPDLPNESGVSPRQLAERIANLDVARCMPPIT